MCVEHYLKNIVYPDDDFDTGPKPVDAYERFNTSAAKAPAGSGGVIFLPWLNGSLAPSENPNVRGGFMNLSLQTTRSHMSRAIMEGIAYNNRWSKGAAEKFIGRPIRGFRFSGGGALSDVWAQILADVLGVPIYQVDDPTNTTVRGTALLTLVSLGYRTFDDITELVKIKQVFKPDEIKAGITAIPELILIGDPTFLISFLSDEVDVFHINDFMKTRGWRFNVLQLPPALHFCVTMPQTFVGNIADRFLGDLHAGVKYAKSKAGTVAETTALYGLAGTLEGNQQVTEMVSGYLDYLYTV